MSPHSAYTAYKQCPLVNSQWSLTPDSGIGETQTGNQNLTTEFARSYKMNSYLRKLVYIDPTHSSGVPCKISQISGVNDNPSKFVMLGDGISMDYVGTTLQTASSGQYDNGQFSMDPSFPPGYLGTSNTGYATPPALRHVGGCNILFVDGHCENVVLATMQRPIVAPPTLTVTTWQSEYLDSSNNPAYITTTGVDFSAVVPAGIQNIHRNPAMTVIWSDLGTFSRPTN